MVERTTVSARLVARDEHRVELALPLRSPVGSALVRPRTTRWERIVGWLGIDGYTDDRKFDGVFKVRGEIRAQLSSDLRSELLQLAANGSPTIHAEKLTFSTANLDIDVLGTIRRLIRVEQALSGEGDRSPYR